VQLQTDLHIAIYEERLYQLQLFAVRAVERMIEVAFTEATRSYDDPPSTEIKSPAIKFAAAFAVPSTSITVVLSTKKLQRISSLTNL
jgi:hypothetical protein